MRRTLFAPAKINLGLAITGRYASGYHRLESVFVPVSLFDRLTLMPGCTDEVAHLWPQDDAPAQARRDRALGTQKNPLLARALAFARRFIPVKSYRITVAKTIPSPAGLGGASADAAALISALIPNAADNESLVKESESLGADVPYFLRFGLKGLPARLCGVGHELAGVSVPRLAGWIAVPDFGFPTAQMFAEVKRWNLPAAGPASAQPLESNLALRLNEIPYSDEPIGGVRLVKNDFDAAAATVFPKGYLRLSRAKVVLAETAVQFFPGHWVVGMTGSGAGLFAATDERVPMPRLVGLKALLQARLGDSWRVIPFTTALAAREKIGP